MVPGGGGGFIVYSSRGRMEDATGRVRTERGEIKGRSMCRANLSGQYLIS